MGRKSQRINLVVSGGQYPKWEAAAAEAGLSVPDYIRFVVNSVTRNGVSIYNNNITTNKSNSNNSIISSDTTLLTEEWECPEQWVTEFAEKFKLRPATILAESYAFHSHAIENAVTRRSWKAAFRNWVAKGKRNGWLKDGPAQSAWQQIEPTSPRDNWEDFIE